jgi:metal-responsive CopG/Arc/MetJ family transcriptional regulator
MRSSKRKAIILRLPQEMIDMIDAVREEVRMNRTAWLRKTIRRQLEYTRQNDLPVLRDPAIRRALMP